MASSEETAHRSSEPVVVMENTDDNGHRQRFFCMRSKLQPVCKATACCGSQREGLSKCDECAYTRRQSFMCASGTTIAMQPTPLVL